MHLSNIFHFVFVFRINYGGIYAARQVSYYNCKKKKTDGLRYLHEGHFGKGWSQTLIILQFLIFRCFMCGSMPLLATCPSPPTTLTNGRSGGRILSRYNSGPLMERSDTDCFCNKKKNLHTTTQIL